VKLLNLNIQVKNKINKQDQNRHSRRKFQMAFRGFCIWTLYISVLNSIRNDVVERELRTLDVHPTNLHQLQDAILSIWANISKECFQHLVESMPRRVKAVLKAKGGQTQY